MPLRVADCSGVAPVRSTLGLATRETVAADVSPLVRAVPAPVRNWLSLARVRNADCDAALLVNRQSFSFIWSNQRTAAMAGNFVRAAVVTSLIHCALLPPCSTEAVSLTMIGLRPPYWP